MSNKQDIQDTIRAAVRTALKRRGNSVIAVNTSFQKDVAHDFMRDMALSAQDRIRFRMAEAFIPLGTILT